jgi:hypothetical protein
MSVVLLGSTSGSVTLQEPAVAGTTIISLPSVSMNMGNGAGGVATNTAFGASALEANSTGGANSAFGSSALSLITSGSGATAFGFQALKVNTGSNNTAFGHNSLATNETGTMNAAFGGGQAGVLTGALGWNTTGSYNTAIGQLALNSNTTASNNTAVGYQAGYSTTTGTESVYIGQNAGYSATTNGQNVFVGRYAGYPTTGNYNAFFGYGAGSAVTSGTKNTIIGRYDGNFGGLDIRTASNYIVLSDGDGNPRIYHNATTFYVTQMSSGAGTNAIRFNTSSGAVTFDTSSARYKDNIRDSVYGLSHVMQMRSAQFEYKDDGRSDVGLIAEELDPIIPELVMKNKDGEPDSVSYDRMVSVLVKAIQELKAEIDALKGTA